jgi:hypothetical protein
LGLEIMMKEDFWESDAGVRFLLTNWTIPQACGFCGIRRTKLYEEIKRGAIRTRKIGARTVVPGTELRRWRAALETTGAQHG